MKLLRSYETYQPSGVECLGQLPQHWAVQRMAAVAGIRVSNVDKHSKEGENPVRLCNYVDVYHNERISSDVLFMAGTAKGEEIRKFRLAVGDVLVTKDSEDWKDIGVPALVEYAADDLVCGYHLAMLRPKGKILDGGYLSYALRNSHVAWQCQVAAVGVTRYGLSQNAIKSVRIPLPPLSEQHAIAHFLNHATERIQHHIHAKEKLIKLLEEYKQVITHQAVTGQIDVRTSQPYSAYKDSGMEWLGKVPEHWEMRRLKYTVSFTGGGTPSKANTSFWSGSIPWVSPKDMTRSRLDDTTDHISRDAVAASAASIVAPGAVLLVVRSGILSRTIPVAINTVPMALNQDMKALRPRNGIIESEYLHGLIEGNQAFLLREWTKHGATVESIEHRLLADSLIPIPPLSEQTAIAKFLTHTNHRISQHRAAVKREIDLLHEYRTRLIADVVTGKLDVREVAARLPQGDPPPPDDNCQDGTEFAA